MLVAGASACSNSSTVSMDDLCLALANFRVSTKPRSKQLIKSHRNDKDTGQAVELSPAHRVFNTKELAEMILQHLFDQIEVSKHMDLIAYKQFQDLRLVCDGFFYEVTRQMHRKPVSWYQLVRAFGPFDNNAYKTMPLLHKSGIAQVSAEGAPHMVDSGPGNLIWPRVEQLPPFRNQRCRELSTQSPLGGGLYFSGREINTMQTLQAPSNWFPNLKTLEMAYMHEFFLTAAKPMHPHHFIGPQLDTIVVDISSLHSDMLSNVYEKIYQHSCKMRRVVFETCNWTTSLLLLDQLLSHTATLQHLTTLEINSKEVDSQVNISFRMLQAFSKFSNLAHLRLQAHIWDGVPIEGSQICLPQLKSLEIRSRMQGFSILHSLRAEKIQEISVIAEHRGPILNVMIPYVIYGLAYRGSLNKLRKLSIIENVGDLTSEKTSANHCDDDVLQASSLSWSTTRRRLVRVMQGSVLCRSFDLLDLLYSANALNIEELQFSIPLRYWIAEDITLLHGKLQPQQAWQAYQQQQQQQTQPLQAQPVQSQPQLQQQTPRRPQPQPAAINLMPRRVYNTTSAVVNDGHRPLAPMEGVILPHKGPDLDYKNIQILKLFPKLSVLKFAKPCSCKKHQDINELRPDDMITPHDLRALHHPSLDVDLFCEHHGIPEVP